MGLVKAKELVHINGIVYAVSGAGPLLLFGKLVDYIGLVWGVGVLIIPTILNLILFATTQVSLQIFGQVLLALNSNVWYVIQQQFAVAYGPAELFGSSLGVMDCIMGIAQLAFTPLCDWLFSDFGRTSEDDASTILGSICLWCSLTVAFSVLMLWWGWAYPLPEIGSTSMKDIWYPEGNDETDIAKISGDKDVEPDIEEANTFVKPEQATCMPGQSPQTS